MCLIYLNGGFDDCETEKMQITSNGKKIFFYSFNTILISPTSLWCHARYHEQQELIVTSSATYACIWDVFKTVSEDSGVVMCRQHVNNIGRKYDIWVKIYIESLVMKSVIKGYSCMYQRKASLPVSVNNDVPQDKNVFDIMLIYCFSEHVWH